ncbi:MAG: YeeE/YedE family protein [Alphaproteobacteria bacterium]
MTDLSMSTLGILAGFAGGLILGAVGLRANFCVMGSISDIWITGDWRRFRGWLLAIAVALLGTEALRLAGAITLDGAAYLAPSFGWVAAILGGLLFGIGMTLAGGCAHRCLVRTGAGSLKALLVIVIMALSAFACSEGVLAPARRWIAEFGTMMSTAKSQDVSLLLATAFGIQATWLRTAIAGALAAVLLWFCFKDRPFRASWRNIVAGLSIGAIVPFGWLVTGGLMGKASRAPDSFNFVTPLGDAASYVSGGERMLSFGIAAVPGVVIGSFLAVAWPWRFRIEAPSDRKDTIHLALGGAFMGVGGTLALGCTIGQGVTGVSTLALGSLLAWGAIVAGSVLCLRYLEWSERV